MPREWQLITTHLLSARINQRLRACQCATGFII